MDAPKKALNPAHPEIFNSNRDSQFTSDEFIAALLNPRFDIKIGMDGNRVFDNIFVEWLGWTVKRSIRRAKTVKAQDSLRRYF